MAFPTIKNFVKFMIWKNIWQIGSVPDFASHWPVLLQGCPHPNPRCHDLVTIIMMMNMNTTSSPPFPPHGDYYDNDGEGNDLDPPSPLRWHRRAFRETLLLQFIRHYHNEPNAHRQNDDHDNHDQNHNHHGNADDRFFSVLHQSKLWCFVIFPILKFLDNCIAICI